MLSIKGTFQNGVAQPDVPIEGHNGQSVVIVFLDEDNSIQESLTDDLAWDTLEQLVKNCAIETGISDLAHQHDHYLHGNPKKA
jgi:hypothetical protein